MVKHMMTTNKTSFYILLPILSGACWGMAGIFVRELTKAGLDNPTIVFTRTALGTLLSLLYLLVADQRRRNGGAARPNSQPRSLLRMRLADYPFVLAIAVFGSLILMICYNNAVEYLSLSLAAILLCTAPVFVLLISAVLFKEKITRKKVICMLLALLGCGLLSGIADLGGAGGLGGLTVSSFGLLMGIISAICNAIFIIMSKLIAVRGYNSFTINFWSSLSASILLMVFVDWSALGSYLAAAPLGHSLFLLVQSVCTSILPSIAYIISMRHVEAGRVAILQSGAEPTAAFIAGLLLYTEIPTPAGLVGMVITIIALMVLSSGRD